VRHSFYVILLHDVLLFEASFISCMSVLWAIDAEILAVDFDEHRYFSDVIFLVC
jgi:hypothetical protein